MNQQRSRRFRSAKDAEVTASEILARSALKGNRELPADLLASRFDSNCITPGTDFMLKLSIALQRWVEFKMTSDPFWKDGASVIVSGPDVPGEGEHKVSQLPALGVQSQSEYLRSTLHQVMDFIRETREAVLKGSFAIEDPQREFWGPNYTHVLYGLDADLIMLGLVTHEPSFMLLREKMSVVMAGRGRNKFRKKKDMLEYDKSDFEVLDLNSLRQMLAIQFRKFADPGMLRAPFDLNRIIDDFVFMCMLVGNDFLPHCPHLEIDSGAISMMMSNYVDLLPEWGDYLTKKEKIHPQRFEQLMYQLSVYEEEHFKRRGYEENEPGWKLSADEENEREDFYGSYYSGEPTPAAAARANRKDGTPPDAEDQPMAPTGNRAFRRKHPGSNSRSYRDFYYEAKLGWKPSDRNRTLFRRREHVREYLEGLHWVLNYYHNGCRSWDWFFPYLYSPLATDMVNLREFYDGTDDEGFGTFSFDIGEPFPSLAQLLSVLPPQSAQLLPQPLAELMTHPSSPLQEYYPPDFTSDPNGKRQSWEAVVQIPFIDADALLDTVQQIIDADSGGKEILTPAERRRNVRGRNHVFVPPGLSEEERQMLEERQSRIDAVAPKGRRKRVLEEDLEQAVSRLPSKRTARTRSPPA
jgi:5'-3' exoribonuclease 1